MRIDFTPGVLGIGTARVMLLWSVGNDRNQAIPGRVVLTIRSSYEKLHILHRRLMQHGTFKNYLPRKNPTSPIRCHVWKYLFNNMDSDMDIS